MGSLWRGLKLGLMIIGTTIGAGFATGREVWEFFGAYGHGSQYGIMSFALLYGVSCYSILSISYQQQSNHYLSVIKELMGARAARIFDSMMILYLFLMTIVMFAGMGAMAGDQGYSELYGIFFCSVLVFIVVVRNIQGIVAVNMWFIPILVGTLILLSLSYWYYEPQLKLIQSDWVKVIPSSIIYTSLNIVPLIAVLSTFGHEMRGKREIQIASILAATGLGIVAYLLNEAIMKVSSSFIDLQIPLIALIRIWPKSAGFWMLFMLMIAILTTAISGVYGAVKRIQGQTGKAAWPIALLICTLVIPFSAFGFENLVKHFYPLFGLLNLFLLVLILLYPLKKTTE